jgi:hypothetical protein
VVCLSHPYSFLIFYLKYPHNLWTDSQMKAVCYPVSWHKILINFVYIMVVCRLLCVVSSDVCETFLEAVQMLYFYIDLPSFHCLQILLSALCTFQTMKLMGLKCREVQKCALTFRLFLLPVYLLRMDLQVLFILLWHFTILHSKLDWTVNFYININIQNCHWDSWYKEWSCSWAYSVSNFWDILCTKWSKLEAKH